MVVVKGRNLQCTAGVGDDEVGGRVSDGKRNSISSGSFIASPTQSSDEKAGSSIEVVESMDTEQLNKKRLSTDAMASVLVKVYLLKDGKKVSKKKTTIKRMETSPIYNESMIFSVPPYMLNSIQIRLTVAQILVDVVQPVRMQIQSIGHVIVGNETNGKGLKHWNQMMTSLRKPVAMWHALRRCPKESTTATETNSSRSSSSRESKK